MNERLMMFEEECRKKVKELLQIPKEDLLTKYMFQEQEIERLNNIINELEKLINEYELGKYDYSIPVFILKDKLKELKESGKHE